MPKSKAPIQVSEGDKTAAILRERGNVHGNWEDNARISRAFHEITQHEANARRERLQVSLSDSQREAIDMILHKVSRIIAGDPTHADHWDDIGGYARLGRDGEQKK